MSKESYQSVAATNVRHLNVHRGVALGQPGAAVHLSLLVLHCVPELVLDVVGADDELGGAGVQRPRAGCY